MNTRNPDDYVTHTRNRWTFNYLDGKKSFHWVMVKEGKDVWTLFAFQKRSKQWGMMSLDGEYKPMRILDEDGDWWNVAACKGIGFIRMSNIQVKSYRLLTSLLSQNLSFY